jgi:hypothetical protein
MGVPGFDDVWTLPFSCISSNRWVVHAFLQNVSASHAADVSVHVFYESSILFSCHAL